MAGEEQLRMAAEIVDKFSAPLREMRRQLQGFSEYGQKAHKEGAAGAKTHEEAILKLREAFRQTTDVAKGGFEPAIEKLGMTALTTGIGLGTVAAAIGAVVTATVGFAGTASRLRNLSVASGLAVNDLRALLDLGPRIGTSSEAMAAGIENFAEHMGRLQGSPGAVATELKQWNDIATPSVRAFLDSLKGLSRIDQFEKAVQAIERMDDVRQRARMWEHLGLPKELATASVGEIDKFLADIRSHLEPLTSGDIVGGRQADQAFAGLRERMESFRDYVGATFVPGVNASLDAVDHFAGGVSTSIGAAISQDTMANFRAIAGDLGSVLGSFSRVGAQEDPLAKGLGLIKDTVGYLSSAPRFTGVADDLTHLTDDLHNFADILNKLNKEKIDWNKVLGLTDFDERWQTLKQTWTDRFQVAPGSSRRRLSDACGAASCRGTRRPSGDARRADAGFVSPRGLSRRRRRGSARRRVRRRRRHDRRRHAQGRLRRPVRLLPWLQRRRRREHRRRGRRDSARFLWAGLARWRRRSGRTRRHVVSEPRRRDGPWQCGRELVDAGPDASCRGAAPERSRALRNRSGRPRRSMGGR
jgi:hypothetical protein